MSSVEQVLLFILLILSMCNSWTLPDSCSPPLLARPPFPPHPPHNRNITTLSPTMNPTYNPTQSPTMNPSKEPTPMPSDPTKSPTPSPTSAYDIKCCEDINKRYFYVPGRSDSNCTSQHGTGDSCILSGDRITTLNLAHCSLTGPIPTELQYMTNLRQLILSHNNIDGVIPDYFNDYKSYSFLQDWQITNTELTGSIPSNIFQYEGLLNIDFRENKKLSLNITNLNLTYSPVFENKQAIKVNFSFLHIHLNNDTDSSFYKLFDTIRFYKFSMRSSINNFTFKWQNFETKNNIKEYHKIYTTETFDIYNNNITNEFPCFFESWPKDIYVANNFITSPNITCYNGRNAWVLLLFQKKAAYKNASKCYQSYANWAEDTDQHKYCIYSTEIGAPSFMRSCCIVTPRPTPKPTEAVKETESKIKVWIINNIAWFALVLILSFTMIIYSIWKSKRKYTQQTEMQRVPPKRPKLSTAGGESLLYGDF